MKIRDRIVKMVKVKASTLVPCPWNFRTHPKKQKEALEGILQEVGAAGAVLVRELKNGKYGLIDGHLRTETFGDQIVTVLVTDLTEKEAKKLLGAYDAIGDLAEVDGKALGELLKGMETGHAGLANLFSELAESSHALDPEDLELDIGQGEAGESPVDSASMEASHVRMVQLFLTTETLPKFQKWVQMLSEEYGTTNLTDTVMKCLRKTCRTLKGETSSEAKDSKVEA